MERRDLGVVMRGALGPTKTRAGQCGDRADRHCCVQHALEVRACHWISQCTRTLGIIPLIDDRGRTMVRLARCQRKKEWKLSLCNMQQYEEMKMESNNQRTDCH
jgi:hypothetical protein